jgi:tetratricopeptide (TPR) repeat protein
MDLKPFALAALCAAPLFVIVPARAQSSFQQMGPGFRDEAAACSRWRGHGDPQSAIKMCTYLIEREPGTHGLVWPYMARADAYGELGQYDLALADLGRAIELPYVEKQNAGGPQNARCFLRAELNRDLDAALADCNDALRFKPGNPAMMDSRALVYYRMGRYAEAIAEYDAVLRARSGFAPSLYMRGVARIKSGDAAGADDVAAANAKDASVAQGYAKFGLVP